MKLCNHKNEHHKHRIIEGKFLIQEYLTEKEYSNSLNSLTKTGVYFDNELLSDNCEIMSWKEVCKQQQRTSKGKIPQWYKIVTEKLRKLKKNNDGFNIVYNEARRIQQIEIQNEILKQNKMVQEVSTERNFNEKIDNEIFIINNHHHNDEIYSDDDDIYCPLSV